MELTILTPEEGKFLEKISFNHEELAAYLNQQLEKYKLAIYTDETIKTAKDDRATLNKFKEALDTKRKEIKKLCLKPYEDFEKQINRLIAMVDEPISAIDGQVKDYEKKLQELKRTGIEEYYNENIENLKDVLPLNKIFNECWLNVTYKMSSIMEEILGAIEKFKQDINTIESLKTEFELQVKDVYLSTLDLSKALNENARLIEQKKKLEAIKPPAPAPKIEDKPLPLPEQIAINIPEETGEILTRDFRIYATKTQIAMLRDFLIKNNIKYGKITDE